MIFKLSQKKFTKKNLYVQVAEKIYMSIVNIKEKVKTFFTFFSFFPRLFLETHIIDEFLIYFIEIQIFMDP